MSLNLLSAAVVIGALMLMDVCSCRMLHTVLLRLLTNVSVDANSVAPDGSTLFDQEVFKTFQQTTKVDDLCLGVKKDQTIFISSM